MHSSNQSLTKLARTAQPCIFEKKKKAPWLHLTGDLKVPCYSLPFHLWKITHLKSVLNDLGDFLCP